MSQYIYIGIQVAAVVLVTISLIYVMVKDNLKDKDILATAALADLIGYLGYLFQMSAHLPGEMLLAMKFAFIGKCILATMMLIYIGRYAGVFHSKIWHVLLFLSDCIVLFFALTSEDHGFFYHKLSFRASMHLEQIVPGPVYVYFLLSQMMKLTVYVYLCNLTLKRSRMIGGGFRFATVFVGIVPIVSLLLMVVDVDSVYDISPLAYTLSLIFLILAVSKMGLTDMVEEAKSDAIEDMMDGLVVVDNDMHLLYENRVAKEIFKEQKKYSLKVQEKMRESMVLGERTEFQSRDRIYEIRSTEIGEGESRKGYMLFAVDVTAREQQERQILALKLEAENASKAKSQFLHNISHEFKTPMNTINRMTRILQNNHVSPEEESYLEQLQQASDKLQRMLSDVLDYSRIDAGKMNLIQVEYLLQDLIRRIYQNTVKRAEVKNLEFSVEIDENIPRTYYGDDLKIQQMLELVISNAIKFTKKGQVLLSVSAETEGSGSCRLAFRVQDTGDGIREEDYGRIFEEFDQGNGEMQEGTGLGLSLAKKLANLMGGDIQFTSTYGVGSEFTVTIVQEVVDEQPIERSGMFEEERIPDYVAPNAMVAVVDDSRMNLKVAEHALRFYRIKVKLFSSGQEFLDDVEHGFHPDFVLMDQMMPEMDGKEILHLFRIFDSDTPVVLMAANAMEETREEALSSGFADCVFKPLREGKLKETLYRILPDDKLVLEDALAAEEESIDRESEYLDERMNRLENCLEYYDLVKAERIIDELMQKTMRIEIQDSFREMEESLAMGDFEKALKQERILKQKVI